MSRRSFHAVTISFASLAMVCASSVRAASDPADLVITDARIYTADSERSMAEALAVREGKLVFIGKAAEAAKLVGHGTRTRSLGGRLVLPGLIDSHIHPLAIADVDRCDLKNEARSLRAISSFVRACIERYRPAAGQWLNVYEWNVFEGNEPDAEHATLRAALDLASMSHPIQLIGNDGHHGAFNSAALAQARDAAGKVVGLSRATLGSIFSRQAALVGVDSHGEPSGAVDEDARALMVERQLFDFGDPAILQARTSITRRLNAAGITAAMDAAADPRTQAVYDALAADGKLTVRLTLAQFYDPENFRSRSGAVDYARIVVSADKVRAKYASHPLIRANFIKLFADGVIEGNPLATPPMLPHAALLRPFLQPIFGRDADGNLTVKGYVDTASTLCRNVRAHPENYHARAAIDRFIANHGYPPAQCTISSGTLQHDRDVIMEFVKRFHLAGYTLHIHAISDGAVRVALDAIEAARAADGISTQHDSLAHVQLAQPADIARIGRNRLFVAFTYSWGTAARDYDLTVIPFIDRVSGNRFADLYPKNGYYATHVYPVAAVKAAGGVLVAGSDAPVGTWDPIPFQNMSVAVTRRASSDAWPPQNPSQRIPIRDVIDAYTINGARFLGRDRECGSLEAGKSADFIVLDQDILQLGDANEGEKIAATRVLETWFKGTQVYQAR